MLNAVEMNGIAITRSAGGIGVGFTQPTADVPVKIEVRYRGQRIGKEWLSPRDQMWRNFYPGIDNLHCVVRVKRGDDVLAELSAPASEPEILPFMVLQGAQQHITENYVSVPPALTITDPVGAVWTLGFQTAPPDLSPRGEYAFNVLRDGVDMHEIASRIERRNGKVRILTAQGWKVWGGQFFF